MPLTVGTAGHIDHGKTWLVRALTGVDTDRLPEERARGISIDLGYAPLDLPDGRRLSLVDVPGHERFVRTMVAGATGIDFFLLVVDAAEGARPQTLEHLAVLRLLGIETGVVAVTKIDAVDEETVELALAEAAELAPEAQAVPVSARTGAGLDRLLAELAAAADRVERQPAGGATRLYVDRVFTLRGIGTVATGTLRAGSVGEGDMLRAEPAGLDVKVRSVQVHDRPVERAEAGQRVAVAVPGVERARLRRGDALFEPGAYGLSYRIDVRLDELEPLRDGLRLHVHHGTADVPARLVRSGEAWAQLRLAVPIVAARGDRVVLRAGRTVGGGIVLDPAPPRALDPVRLGLLERGDPQSLVRALVDEPVTRASLERRGLLRGPELLEGLAAVERSGDWYFSAEWLGRLRASVRERLRVRAEQEPLDPGLSVGELFGRAPWAGALMPLLELDRRGPKVYLPGVAAELGERTAAAGELERALSAAGPNPIKIDDRNLAAYLEGEGRLIRVGDGLALGAQAYEEGRRVLVEECERGGGRITLARFRDLTGSSRRSAQLVLERFDADGLTRRIGDERVLRRAARGTIER